MMNLWTLFFFICSILLPFSELAQFSISTLLLQVGGGYVAAYWSKPGKEVDTFLPVDYSQRGTAYVKMAINYVQHLNKRELASGPASHGKWWSNYGEKESSLAFA